MTRRDTPPPPKDAPDRRALDPARDLLDRLLTDSEHQRESLHRLQGSATVLNLRTEGMERELRALSQRVGSALDATEGSPMGRALALAVDQNRTRIEELERRQDAHADYITQLRTGLGLLKLLVGTSVAGTLGTVAALGKSFGWW